MTLEQLQGAEYESSDDDYLSDDSLNEFWKVEGVELTREKKLHKERLKMLLFDTSNKVEVDAKLEQFLNIHSMNLTPSVREYIEKSKKRTMTDHETISSLGMLAFERTKFLKSIKMIETKY